MEIEMTPKMKAKALYDSGVTTPKAIASRAGVCERTAYRYIASFKAGGSHERKKYKTREKPKQTSKLVQKVLRKAKERRHIWSSRAIAASAGMSHTTACTVMKNKGVKYQSYKKQLKLTQENMETRLRFARNMKRRESDWGFTFFSDERSFWRGDTGPRKVWTNDPLKEKGIGTKGIKLNCWGAISARGTLNIEIFEMNLKATDLVNIMQRRLNQMKRLYPDGFIWQQDGSGVHRAQIVNNFIYQNMPQNLDWPSYSPDVSPLENVWKWLKGEVAKDCPKTLRSLKNSIKKHWNRIDVDF